MHPLGFPLLANENIHDEVVSHLRKQGLQIESIKERNLRGSTDEQIMTLAETEGKVILTHDADFGRLLHFSQGITAGVIFLRPCHIDFCLQHTNGAKHFADGVAGANTVYLGG